MLKNEIEELKNEIEKRVEECREGKNYRMKTFHQGQVDAFEQVLDIIHEMELEL